MSLLSYLLSRLHLNNPNNVCITNEKFIIYILLINDRKQLNIWYNFRLKFHMFGPDHIFKSYFLIWVSWTILFRACIIPHSNGRKIDWLNTRPQNCGAFKKTAIFWWILYSVEKKLLSSFLSQLLITIAYIYYSFFLKKCLPALFLSSVYKCICSL